VYAPRGEPVSDQSSELLVIEVTRPSPGLHVIALTGEMDLANSAEFTARITGIVDTDGCRVVIDLSALTFLDSSGINALVLAAKDIEAGGGEVTLAVPTSHIRQVFDIVNLADVIAIEHSREAALGRAGATGSVGDQSIEA
jgi:anti-anti-sigma factor